MARRRRRRKNPSMSLAKMLLVPLAVGGVAAVATHAYINRVTGQGARPSTLLLAGGGSAAATAALLVATN